MNVQYNTFLPMMPVTNLIKHARASKTQGNKQTGWDCYKIPPTSVEMRPVSRNAEPTLLAVGTRSHRKPRLLGRIANGLRRHLFEGRRGGLGRR